MIRVLFVSFFAIVSCLSQNPQVCQQLQSVYETMCPNKTLESNNVLNQGPPGKRGPIGQKGEMGAKGAAGTALEVGNFTAILSQRIQEETASCRNDIKVMDSKLQTVLGRINDLERKIQNLTEDPNSPGQVSGGHRVPNPRIRLSDGTEASGRVEIYHNGVWGTICDDDWGPQDGAVVCRMLGYSTVQSVSTVGGGETHIWLDNVQCLGTETDISACGHAGWGVHNCAHSEDAGVNCV